MRISHLALSLALLAIVLIQATPQMFRPHRVHNQSSHAQIITFDLKDGKEVHKQLAAGETATINAPNAQQVHVQRSAGYLKMYYRPHTKAIPDSLLDKNLAITITNDGFSITSAL